MKKQSFKGIGKLAPEAGPLLNPEPVTLFCYFLCPEIPRHSEGRPIRSPGASTRVHFSDCPLPPPRGALLPLHRH